jgi:hypothetical protein
MRKYLTTAMAIALMSGVSYADLQNVEVGGEIRIRGNSYYDVDGYDGEHNQFTEQYTAVSVTADFSDEVSANITFDRYGNWGGEEDGRSDSLETNLDADNDFTGRQNDDVHLYEANIVLQDAIAGFDLTIGRQEVILGSEFLVGNENTAGGFTHRSFDGIRADYATDAWNVSLLTLKVEEGDAPDLSEVDDDIDLNIIYGTYTGLENHTIDAYLMQLRGGSPGEDNDEILTIGARAAGNFGNFDYELEIATQSGDDGEAVETDFEGDALNLEVGYTFDTNMQPRVFAGYAMFSGDDEDYGFQRLFSDWEYSEFLGDGDVSNVNILRLGVSANVSEKISLTAVVSDFEIDDEDGTDDYAVHTHSDEGDELGTEIGLYATYQYSEDVAVEVGYATLLLGDTVEDTLEDDGDEDEDPSYVYAEISVSF